MSPETARGRRTKNIRDVSNSAGQPAASAAPRAHSPSFQISNLKSQIPPDICPFCRVNPPSEFNWQTEGTSYEWFCPTCNQATSLVFTSIDDARQSIKTASLDVIKVALVMAGPRRKTLVKLLEARQHALLRTR